MNRIKEFLLDENKFAVNKINFILNCLIISSAVFYHEIMSYVFYLLMGFVMLKLMLKEKYINKSKFNYFYLLICIIITLKILSKLLYDFII
ncbi:hypothetical protein J2Z76_000961 [Sedimentibacter acidaminivorans]|uniref:Uncharacterized protein n=1 Tax=Sedimentibacter acidaminivorans TaxID=913099 RepID=A0ABS4GBR0_9FIRM|nr:hypothetical protein [Sedimentibacter acidaminivorans]